MGRLDKFIVFSLDALRDNSGNQIICNVDLLRSLYSAGHDIIIIADKRNKQDRQWIGELYMLAWDIVMPDELNLSSGNVLFACVSDECLHERLIEAGVVCSLYKSYMPPVEQAA
ncbi:hypothetical protein Q6301_20380 [Klebsiella quasipneumoniae]|uniref:hypothetical protein n=1 Tax=Klebsiella quasipneumoniae TaxID=1463165 RepID=UPI0027311EF8|nr:hypothetical protein [Klebsiella quasipneumoniae]MDP1297935.1 hypothetical protein [Klebsiella quasipneumoniae]